MVPGKATCPSSWTQEYNGYLMAERYNHHRSTYECVDQNPETVPGGAGDENGALFYHVEATCTGLQDLSSLKDLDFWVLCCKFT